jgi:hypothetical protein
MHGAKVKIIASTVMCQVHVELQHVDVVDMKQICEGQR